MDIRIITTIRDKEHFVNGLEKTYSPLRGAMKKLMFIYLSDFTPEELTLIFNGLLLNYSSVYGKCPDIAQIEKIKLEYNNYIKNLVGGECKQIGYREKPKQIEEKTEKNNDVGQMWKNLSKRFK